MTDKAPLSEQSYQNDSARLYQCSKGSHARINLFATTIFDLNILQFHWLQMIGFAERANIAYDKQDVQQLLPNENVAQVLVPTIDVEVQQPGEQEERERAEATKSVTQEELDRHRTAKCHDYFTPPAALDEGFDGHPFFRIDSADLTEALFDRMWEEGTPIVIDNAGKGMTQEWTPQGFKDRFGDEHCCKCLLQRIDVAKPSRSEYVSAASLDIFDCQAEIAEDSTIRDFYNLFDKTDNDGDHKVFKLKDWPWNTEFKEHCPELYDDFLQSLPVPDYTRRDGITNISAFVSAPSSAVSLHYVDSNGYLIQFPTNTTPPDIGPKLYSALVRPLFRRLRSSADRSPLAAWQTDRGWQRLVSRIHNKAGK